MDGSARLTRPRGFQSRARKLKHNFAVEASALSIGDARHVRRGGWVGGLIESRISVRFVGLSYAGQKNMCFAGRIDARTMIAGGPKKEEEEEREDGQLASITQSFWTQVRRIPAGMGS